MQGSTGPPRRPLREWFASTAALMLPLAQLGGGVYFLWRRGHEAHAPSLLATAGVVLILAALAQLRVLYPRLRARCPERLFAPLGARVFWLGSLSGVVAAYALNLLSGLASPHGFCMFLALWQTALHLPLALPAARQAQLAALLRRRGARLIGWTVCGLLLAPLAGELGLRAYAYLFDEPIPAIYRTARLKLPPGFEWDGRRANRQGYWDQEFQTAVPPGTFRVAVVGDELTLSGDARTNFLAQIERRASGVEVYNFGLPRAGTDAYVAQLAREIAAYKPDLVLAVISVGASLTHDAPAPNFFDDRGLYLYQLGSLWLRSEELFTGGRLLLDRANSRQSHLRRCARELAVCRAPISREMHARWDDLFADLDQLARQCAARGMALGLVVAPCEFQIDPALCQAARRRAGYRAEEIDLELPQRRLAQFAQRRHLLMIDLLPYLRGEDEPSFARNQSRFNDHGHALAADVIGHWMQSRFSNRIAAATHGPR